MTHQNQYIDMLREALNTSHDHVRYLEKLIGADEWFAGRPGVYTEKIKAIIEENKDLKREIVSLKASLRNYQNPPRRMAR